MTCTKYIAQNFYRTEISGLRRETTSPEKVEAITDFPLRHRLEVLNIIFRKMEDEITYSKSETSQTYEPSHGCILPKEKASEQQKKRPHFLIVASVTSRGGGFKTD